MKLDYEEFSGRIRGARGPRQMILGCNPDAAGHWINLRLIIDGQAKVYYSGIDDNPTATADYRERLDRDLTGVQHDRLVKGRWVSAEGIVHDAWDPARQLDRRRSTSRQTGVVSAPIDFGWEHPCCAQWWALDGDGRMYRYREIHLTHLHVEDLASEIVRLSEGFVIPFSVDHSAGIRLAGVPCVPANKAVEPGLRAVNGRLKVAGDGKPRMFLLRDALAHPPDPRAVERRWPTCTEEEFSSYVWDVRASDGWSKDQPVKMHDDGMDATRYATMAADVPEPFLVVGDRVIR